MKVKILSRKEVFSDRIKIEKAEIALTNDEGKEHIFSRLRVNREDAAAVLLYHRDRRVFILIRQYRYPAEDTHELFLEIPAGKIEEGHEALETIVRETEEETGYVIPKEDFVFLSSFYASPGYTTEKYHLFFAEVDDKTKKRKGGGLHDEGEFIENVEINADDFFNGIDNGHPMDAKTLLAAWIVRKKFER